MIGHIDENRMDDDGDDDDEYLIHHYHQWLNDGGVDWVAHWRLYWMDGHY